MHFVECTLCALYLHTNILKYLMNGDKFKIKKFDNLSIEIIKFRYPQISKHMNCVIVGYLSIVRIVK